MKIPDAIISLEQINKYMVDCTLCPRNCHVNRLTGQLGFCGQPATLRAARASLHLWEEPCISGESGSGTIFFSGCNMRCIFCQNHNIAIGRDGKELSLERLAEIFLELQEKGAHNINLVTPSHYIPQIAYSIKLAKTMGLSIPIVYNTSSYEEVASLQLLDGLIDIYLPDLKYYSVDLSTEFSHAPDYFEKACAAIAEMYRQVGPPVMNASTGLMQRGVIVRHLLLPAQTKDSKKILRYLHETYGNDIYVSIMNQYTPLGHVAEHPLLNKKITDAEYQRVLDFSQRIGIEQGYTQDGDVANESFIPEFDGQGL